MRKILLLLVLLVFSLGIFGQDNYIVSLKEGQDKQSFLNEHKKSSSQHFNVINGFLIKAKASDLIKLRSDPRVKYVSEDSEVPLSEIQYPTYYWNLGRIDDRYFTDVTWDTYVYDYTGIGVDIYIVDSGIYNLSEFEGRVTKGYGKPLPIGCSNHGTMVASVAAGRTHGVAKQANLIDVRTYPCSGSTTVSEILKGFDWISRRLARTSRTSIVNMSFSIENNRNLALEDGARNLYNKGAFLSIAAGNNGINACNGSPSSVTEGLVVSGFNGGDSAWGWNYSPYCAECGFNWGSCVDIYAPGFAGVKWVDVAGAELDGSAGGTSFAAPHGAGLAALYLEVHPNASPSEVHDFIIANGTQNVLSGVQPSTPNLMLYTRF